MALYGLFSWTFFPLLVLCTYSAKFATACTILLLISYYTYYILILILLSEID